MVLWFLAVSLFSLASATCYNVTKPLIGGHWVVCDPIVLEGSLEPGKVKSDILWSGNISNSSAWFYIPPQAGGLDVVYRLHYSFQGWGSPAIDLDLLYTRMYDGMGTDYENVYFPNGTNTKGTSFVLPPKGSPIFFRIWTLAVDAPPKDIGPTSIHLGLGSPHSLGQNKPLNVDLAPGEWAFPLWPIHPVDHLDWVVFFQLEVECGGQGLPIESFVDKCGEIMCQYATTDISSWKTKHLGSSLYMLAYPRDFLSYDKSLIATLHNNNSASCTIRAEAYTYYYPAFPVSDANPSYTSDPIELESHQYSLLSFLVQVMESNFTIHLEAQDPSNSTRYGIFYHPYPYYEAANMVDATMAVVQDTPSSVLKLDVTGWVPYQPFAVYNFGSKGTFKVTVASHNKPSTDNRMWILIGSIVGGFVVFVVVVASLAFYFKRRAQYVTLTEKS